MSSLYYLGIGVVSLSMAIYNFEISSRGGDIQCKDKDDQYDQSDIYRVMGILIAVIFIIMLVLTLFLSFVINTLSNQTPDDFIDMGKCKKFLACFCKIFPPILLVLSWLNLIFIIVIWILVAIGRCKNSALKDTSSRGEFDKRSYFNDFKILNLVNSIIWLLLHYGGSIIREMTYIEPFMYSPDTGSPNCCRTLILKKLGP